MKSNQAIAFVTAGLVSVMTGNAGVFTIGGFTFDEANSAQSAAITEGPQNLKIENTRFGKYSKAYLEEASVRSNAFSGFDRSASVGWLLEPARVPGSKANFHAKSVALADGKSGKRSRIELGWGDKGIRNQPGPDLVIYESGSPEGFAVSVLRIGATDFSRAKYQVADNYDPVHEASAYALDLRDFGVADGEMVQSICIQNIFPESTTGADKVDTVSGQGMLIYSGDNAYSRGFPLLRKTNESAQAKSAGTAKIVYAVALNNVGSLAKNGEGLAPGMCRIAGFSFNPSNAVKRVFIAEGPANLKVRVSALFAPQRKSRTGPQRFSDYANFDRSQTIGQLLRSNDGSARRGSGAMHVMFPDIESSPPTPNVDRCTIEMNWAGAKLRNQHGDDFVVYEVDHWEGFAVSVQKAGSTQWTPYRYQFHNSSDAGHVVIAVAFDLSNFGLRDGEMISAIRIRNLFSSKSAGADKVDNVSGQGNVIYAKDPKYKSGFPLLMKRGGKEFPPDLLDGDIVYVVGLHDIEQNGLKASR